MTRGTMALIGLALAASAWSTRSPAAPKPPPPAPPKRPPPKRPLPLEPGPWSLAILAAARADLGKGETPPNSNMGAFPAELLGAFGFKPPQNYCAAAVAKWIRDAGAELGMVPPIAGSPGAKATMGQLIAAGYWAPVSLVREGYRPPPGSIGVTDRSDPNRPETSWWGHIFIVSGWRSDRGFNTIEANRLDHVAEFFDRTIDDARLLGFGNLDASIALARSA